jgi:hypothetical protein
MAYRSSYDYASIGTTPTHATPAAILSTPSRRSGSRAPSSLYPALHPTTLSQTGISIRVNKEPSFRFLNPKGRDCQECVRRGYKPGARTQLHTHIKEKHLEDAQTKTLLYSTCPFCSEGSFAHSSVLAEHIIDAHTNNRPSSAPFSRSHSSSGPQGSPIPGPSPVNTPSYGQSMNMRLMYDAASGAPSHTNGYGLYPAPPAYPQEPYLKNGQQNFALDAYQTVPQPGYGYPPSFQNRNYQMYGGTQ